MHPSLAPHLHGRPCQEIIRLLHKCHEDHPFGKFFGQCNEFKYALSSCLTDEYKAKRKQNQEEARRRKEKWEKSYNRQKP
eukprot:m.139880 g.139880  ORF g.139880 m.139880 type:complete len:80 (+) comp38287_c1_seq18:1451-1690(+)